MSHVSGMLVATSGFAWYASRKERKPSDRLVGCYRRTNTGASDCPGLVWPSEGCWIWIFRVLRRTCTGVFDSVSSYWDQVAQLRASDDLRIEADIYCSVKDPNRPMSIALARARGITVDAEKLVVIGWSTGGHLAMTSAWTSVKSGIKPPNSILSFYGPTDFENEYFTTRQGAEYPERSLPMSTIRTAPSDKLISNYNSPNLTASEQNLGFLSPGDPRSELVLSLFKDGSGLSILLNGFPESASSLIPTPVSKSQIRSISPLAHIRRCVYRTPTFIVHGERDEVVPHTMAVDLVREMSRMGVQFGVKIVPRVRHNFDLKIKPGIGCRLV
ncbi:hypothetical protein DL98DRAFT_564950 [Cadophora sp. DSE1049]|nr:hypothetical protein DL98DRAFT_564950 [Cadophora sp. DSE1049]